MLKGDGARYRNWDSCSFPIYTKMPAENPREEKWRRVRQKVNHKYAFYPSLFDTIACTGCGRCIRLCPVNWDIAQTLSCLPAGTPVTENK
jgi:sulfhydrogenase subunit beta (sulfur reductase)